MFMPATEARHRCQALAKQGRPRHQGLVADTVVPLDESSSPPKKKKKSCESMIKAKP